MSVSWGAACFVDVYVVLYNRKQNQPGCAAQLRTAGCLLWSRVFANTRTSAGSSGEHIAGVRVVVILWCAFMLLQTGLAALPPAVRVGERLRVLGKRWSSRKGEASVSCRYNLFLCDVSGSATADTFHESAVTCGVTT